MTASPRDARVSDLDYAKHTLAGKTILVVDDSNTYRNAGASMLRKLGYDNILTAQDGAEGLKMLQQHATKIGLVLSDVDMPRMNGLDMLTEIRYNRSRATQNYSASVPVVIATAESSEDRMMTAHQLDAAYMKKPYTQDALIKSMAEAMRLSADLDTRAKAVADAAHARTHGAAPQFALSKA